MEKISIPTNIPFAIRFEGFFFWFLYNYRIQA